MFTKIVRIALATSSFMFVLGCAEGIEANDGYATFGNIPPGMNEEPGEPGESAGAPGEDPGAPGDDPGAPEQPDTDEQQEPEQPAPVESCGDGIFDAEIEVCDGALVDGQTCASLGFDGGVLGCSDDCSAFDTSQCSTQSCGDGFITEVEVCDGEDLDGASCESLGFAGGTLACQPGCGGYDTSGCVATLCGNNEVEEGEACDAFNLDGETCASQGYGAGPLGCADDCGDYDTSACTDGNCCMAKETSGCQVPFVESCVCNQDSFCCDNAWDTTCVQIAVNSCMAQCG